MCVCVSEEVRGGGQCRFIECVRCSASAQCVESMNVTLESGPIVVGSDR